MALFSRNNKDKKDAPAAAAPAASTALSTDRNLASVLIEPVVRREKAYTMMADNVYTFIVHKSATKRDVADAIRALYNVTPVKVNTVTKATRTRKNGRTGQYVKDRGEKKAYVYLKKGDTINLV